MAAAASAETRAQLVSSYVHRWRSFCHPGAYAADRTLLATPATPVMPANTSLADLTATQAIAMLCARETTAVSYVQALFVRFDSGGFECLNAFISLNRSQVGRRLSPSS